MIRTIIKIAEDACSGCGLCAQACHEGAIRMVDGKAKLLRDDYCDGLGNCLPVCPTGAITFEQREAAEYNEAAVKAHMAGAKATPPSAGCPGSHAHALKGRPADLSRTSSRATPSQLSQWPVQIKLVPVNASYFEEAHLLIAADCAAYACADFHSEFMRGKITLIGCPKLDAGDYSEKLADILRSNRIRSVTVVRMEVPCCGGIENAAKAALQASGKTLPWRVVTLTTGGEKREDSF